MKANLPTIKGKTTDIKFLVKNPINYIEAINKTTNERKTTMKVTTQNRHNQTLVKINGKTRCYYDKITDDSYNFYLGKPSDKIVFGKNALTLSELEEEVNKVVDQYKELLEFFN